MLLFVYPKAVRLMTRSTEARKNELREQISTCHDPDSLLIDLLHDNERLRSELKRWEAGKNK